MQIIRASEVGEYMYCARSWWLRRVAGEIPDGQAQRDLGTALHARHSRTVARSSMLLWLAGILLLAGLGALLFAL